MHPIFSKPTNLNERTTARVVALLLGGIFSLCFLLDALTYQ
jgi:hypothetical protein